MLCLDEFFYWMVLVNLLNFDCAFHSCDFKCNNVEEIEFLKHLKEEHSDELLKISKKENMSVKSVEMITTSNSNVFINT
jgi:hypothetical protein